MEAEGMVVDTNIFIDHLRAKDKSNTVLRKIPIDQEIFISSVTIYELLMGATNPEKWKDVDKITRGLKILSFDEPVAVKAGKIFHELKEANKLIEFRDIFIGATALIYEVPVLTHNIKDFARIKGIKVIDPTQMNF
jgi:tRNA(fMet)-specific endonuclease VapC